MPSRRELDRSVRSLGKLMFVVALGLYFLAAALFIKGVLTWKDFPLGALAADG